MAVKAVRQRGSLLWLQGLGCGVLATFALPVALLAAALLAPALLALTVDRLPGRPVARAVLLAAAAASVRPLVRLWQTGHDMTAAMTLLADPGVLGAAWAAGAAGWLLAELSPVLICTAMNARTAARVGVLRSLRKRCEEEWEVPPPPG